jgi:hypothetical protein
MRERLLKLSKQELGDLLNEKQRKIDSGRFEGRDVQIRDLALEIYLLKFDAPH